VVVKEVPAGATAIGIPARIVEVHDAGSGRFAAYAVARELNDPLSKAIHELIEQNAENEKMLEQVVAELKRLSAKVEEQEARTGM